MGERQIMKTFAGFWGNIKLKTAVAALVLTSITITIIAFSGSGYLDLRR